MGESGLKGLKCKHILSLTHTLMSRQHRLAEGGRTLTVFSKLYQIKGGWKMQSKMNGEDFEWLTPRASYGNTTLTHSTNVPFMITGC